jgi:Ca-activated chloride channel family protein
MTTNTPDGPFFVTLNQRQRDASLGPCTELVTGTFCHDTTDDPALLADIVVIQRSLSFVEADWQSMNETEINTAIDALTGAAQ